MKFVVLVGAQETVIFVLEWVIFMDVTEIKYLKLLGRGVVCLLKKNHNKSVHRYYSVLWVVFLLFCLIALSACCVYLISSKGHVKLEDDINDTVKVSSDIEVKVVDVISKRFYTIADPFNFGNSPNPDSHNKIGALRFVENTLCVFGTRMVAL